MVLALLWAVSTGSLIKSPTVSNTTPNLVSGFFFSGVGFLNSKYFSRYFWSTNISVESIEVYRFTSISGYESRNLTISIWFLLIATIKSDYPSYVKFWYDKTYSSFSLISSKLPWAIDEIAFSVNSLSLSLFIFRNALDRVIVKLKKK